MTDQPGPPTPVTPPGDATPHGPEPLGVGVLADLHAGVLDDAPAAEIAARVAGDAQSRAVLAALDATVADLAALGAAPVAVPLPEHVSARLDAALADLRHPPAVATTPAPTAPVVDLAAARRARAGRGRLIGAGALAAAAAAVGVVVLDGLTGGGSSTPGTAVAQPLDLGDGRLGTTVLASLGTTDLGPLSDPATLAGCLAANDVPDGTPVLGSTQVLLRGEPGTLLLLTDGTLGSFTALVVGPGCSAEDPAQLARQQIGAR